MSHEVDQQGENAGILPGEKTQDLKKNYTNFLLQILNSYLQLETPN